MTPDFDEIDRLYLGATSGSLLCTRSDPWPMQRSASDFLTDGGQLVGGTSTSDRVVRLIGKFDLTGWLTGAGGWRRIQCAVQRLNEDTQRVAGTRQAAEWALLAAVVEPLVGGDEVGVFYGCMEHARHAGAIAGETASGFLNRELTSDDQRQIAELLQLRAAWKVFSAAARRVAKGQDLRFTATGFEHRDPPDRPDLDDAIALYDERRAAVRGFLGMGIGVVGSVAFQPGDDPAQMAAAVDDIRLVPGLPSAKVTEILESRDLYYLGALSLDRLMPAFAVDSEEHAVRLAFLRVWLETVGDAFVGGQAFARQSGLHSQLGLLDGSLPDLHRLVGRRLREVGVPEHHTRRLRQLEDALPLVFLPYGRQRVMVDLVNLTQALVGEFGRHQGGAQEAEVGRALEVDLQAHDQPNVMGAKCAFHAADWQDIEASRRHDPD